MNRDNFLAGNTVAFDHPGIPLNWTPSSKGAVGTAYFRARFNKAYCPTIDQPQIRDLQ